MWKQHGTTVIAHGTAAFAHIETPRAVAARENILALFGVYRLTQGMVWDALALLEVGAGRTFLPSERRTLTALAVERFRGNPKSFSEILVRVGFGLPQLQRLRGAERVRAREILVHALYAALRSESGVAFPNDVRH